MASVSPTPLKTEAEYERALCEVERILQEPHEETIEDRYFAYLLGRIADYHETLPPPKRDANLDRLSELEQRRPPSASACPSRTASRPATTGARCWAATWTPPTTAASAFPTHPFPWPSSRAHPLASARGDSRECDG